MEIRQLKDVPNNDIFVALTDREVEQRADDNDQGNDCDSNSAA